MAYVLTGFSCSLSNESIELIQAELKSLDVEVSKVKNLSKRACDFYLSKKLDRESLEELRNKHSLDLVLQEDPRPTYKLAVFDMDSTLIQAEVIDELAKRAGVGDEVAKVTEAAMRGELDFNQSLNRRLSCIEGLSESVLEDIATNLPITDGLPELMQGLKSRGIKTAILSGGFTYFAHELQRRFGFDYVHANELEIVDGALTGKLTSEIVNAERKKYHLEEICKKEGLELSESIAVGDGANDLLMIKASGLGIAFHAKPLVREQAPHQISTIGLDAILYILGIF